MASVVVQPLLPLRLRLKPNFATLRRGVPSALTLIAHRLSGVAVSRSLVLYFALTDSNASASLEDESILPLLQELSACLGLPPDYLSKLPGDLRLDLNDAAFDLASGPVFEECGKEFGELFSSLSRAWEQADTMTSNIIANNLPSLHDHLTKDVKQAIGKRLLSAGRRFEAMGQYGEGELQKIAKAMIKIGKLLSKGPVVETEKRQKKDIRTFKFGELQVAVTPEKAYIGAVIAAAFGLLSWELSQAIQNIPDSSFQYANDNAVILAKSLRGALLVLGYSSAILSAFALVGLLLLGRQLSSEGDSKEQ